LHTTRKTKGCNKSWERPFEYFGRGILENPTKVGPNFSQKFGEILQAENNLTFSQANISSGNTSSDILSLGQSELVSGIPKNTSKSVGIGEEEKNEDGTDETIDEETEDE
jgi:hypothetical protein